MGLKPKCAYVPLSTSVMERSLIYQSKMLLKDETTCPNGSPRLEESSTTKSMVSNGIRSSNGYSQVAIPSSFPLQVEVTAYGKVPQLDRSPSIHDDPSLQSGTLPATSLNSNNSSTSSILPKGDLQFDFNPRAESSSLKLFSTTSSNSNSPVNVHRNSYAPPIRHTQGGNSAQPIPSAAQARKEVEQAKKRQTHEKVSRCKDGDKLKFIIPQCTAVASLQLSFLARKMRRTDSGLPAGVRKQVFGEDESVKSPPCTVTSGDFEELTDTSDMDDDAPKTVEVRHVTWSREKARFEGNDERIRSEIEDKHALLAELTSLLEASESTPSVVFEVPLVHEETCARSRALVQRTQRCLHHREKRVRSVVPVDYAEMKPSTSKESMNSSSILGLLLPEDVPIEKRMQYHLKHVSKVPSHVIRKKVDRSVWMNTKEIDEESQRNGWKREAERERRRARIQAGKERGGNDSSDYQETDQSDDDLPPKTRSKLTGHKKPRGRPPKEGKLVPGSLTKLGRRHSVATASRPARQSMYECDELLDFGTAHLPQKMDYAEIKTPTCHQLLPHEVAQIEQINTNWETSSSDGFDLFLSIAQNHHQQEFLERRRFKAYRDKAARDKAEREHSQSVHGSDPPSGQHTPQPFIVPPFEPSSIQPLVPEKLSSAIPFSPRVFI